MADEDDRVWRREEFERGFKEGREGRGYQPTSRPYIEGYESGELAAERFRRGNLILFIPFP